MSRPRLCIYCGAPATGKGSKEHVIPKWIASHFGLRYEALTHTKAIGLKPLGPTPIGDYAAGIYCDSCHKWVNTHIENADTRSLLKKVFPGDAMVFSRRDQERLATWAVKTAYADWGKQFKTRGVPIAHRRHLREHAVPPPEVWVSASRCTGDLIQLRTGRTHVTPGDGSPTFWTYEFNFAIGRLAFKVWSPTRELPGLEYKTPTSQAVRLWPMGEENARWPPGRVLSPDALVELWELNPRANRV